MPRILLITLYGFQNTGIRLLSAVLRKGGFDAPILYLKGWANNDVRPPTDREYFLLQRHIEQTAPQLIGIGFGTPYLKIAIETTGVIRRISDAHVIWGGVHPTLSPEDCIEHADSVCIGEGEGPILDLANALREGRDITGIENLWVRTQQGIHRNPLRSLVADLDELPYAESFQARVHTIDGNRLSAHDPMSDNALYRVFASRGCPFHCAFCYNNQYRQIYKGLGRYHRIRTVENVLDEIEAALEKWPSIRRIRFDDDSFVFPKSWIDEFVRVYPERIGLPFDILLNPSTSSEELLRKLKGAGLVHVQVGIQSASDKELEQDFARSGDKEQLLELARQLHEIGIDVTYDIILDNPLSDDEDKRAMVELLLQLPRPFSLFVYSLTVFPKSEIATRLLAAGKITEDQIEGRATKSFRQFRLTLNWPRPKADTFYACLITLTSKTFVPRGLLRRLLKSRFLKKHPFPLRMAAEAANYVKLAGLAWKMFRRGELSIFKLREYASPRRRLIQ